MNPLPASLGFEFPIRHQPDVAGKVVSLIIRAFWWFGMSICRAALPPGAGLFTQRPSVACIAQARRPGVNERGLLRLRRRHLGLAPPLPSSSLRAPWALRAEEAGRARLVGVGEPNRSQECGADDFGARGFCFVPWICQLWAKEPWM